MRIAVIGAGVAGLSSAKVLGRVGHEVTSYEKAPDLGGVWSATRRYPGVTTQSPRDTYAFSDFPYPGDLPEWPTGQQVQSYLEAYAERFDLRRHVHLSTEVRAATPTPTGWRLRIADLNDGRTREREFDHLVVANGVFSAPAVPEFEGRAEFEAVGGQVLTAADFHDLEQARRRHVVVVGYGKSSCDVAVEVSRTAERTHVVARNLVWKVPRRIAGTVNFKYLLLTRLGEALFGWQEKRGLERFLHGPGDGLRRRMLTSVGRDSVRSGKLHDLGLVPPGTMEDIVRGPISLVSEGFFEGVEAGRIEVHRDQVVERLLVHEGRPCAALADGSVVAADLVVCATGYRQALPFLDAGTTARLLDERGNFRLYRQVLPVGVENLSFAGYDSSFFSPLNAEIGAVWNAARLAGLVEVPDEPDLEAHVHDRLVFMDDVTGGHHQHGTKVVPFSLHVLDELLTDLGVDIARHRRALQWILPVDPGDYRDVLREVERRVLAATASPTASPTTSPTTSPTAGRRGTARRTPPAQVARPHRDGHRDGVRARPWTGSPDRARRELDRDPLP